MPARFLRRSSLLAVACLAACGGSVKNPPDVRPSGGPRMRQHAGDERSPVRLVLEVDPRRQASSPATLHTFTLSVEERVTAPEDGVASVSARLVDVAGASGDPQLSDRLALALDDLKISFRRTDRGDIQALKVEGAHAPLDEGTARAVVMTLFGAGRGPHLPEKNVLAQDDWTIEADTEILGVVTHMRHFYTLVVSKPDELQLRTKGHMEGITSLGNVRRSVNGDTFAEETLDPSRGVIVSGEYEWTQQVDDDPADRDTPGVGKIHVRVERGLIAQQKKK